MNGSLSLSLFPCQMEPKLKSQDYYKDEIKACDFHSIWHSHVLNKPISWLSRPCLPVLLYAWDFKKYAPPRYPLALSRFLLFLLY